MPRGSKEEHRIPGRLNNAEARRLVAEIEATGRYTAHHLYVCIGLAVVYATDRVTQAKTTIRRQAEWTALRDGSPMPADPLGAQP